MAANTLQERIARVAALYQELDQVVAQVTPDQYQWQPAENVWSVAEILAHIDEFPSFFLGELLKVKANPDVRWGRTMDNPARLQAVAQGKGRSLAEARQRLAASREHVLATLGSLTDADLTIEAEHVNPKFGRKSMGWLVDHFIIEHLENHIKQIRRNLGQYAARQAG